MKTKNIFTKMKDFLVNEKKSKFELIDLDKIINLHKKAFPSEVEKFEKLKSALSSCNYELIDYDRSDMIGYAELKIYSGNKTENEIAEEFKNVIVNFDNHSEPLVKKLFGNVYVLTQTYLKGPYDELPDSLKNISQHGSRIPGPYPELPDDLKKILIYNNPDNSKQ